MFSTLVAIAIVPFLAYLSHLDSMMDSNISTTFALIKPDGYLSTQAILSDIEKEGFKIVRKKQIKLTKNQAKEFYQEHSERGFFDELVDFITSGPVTVMELQKEDAVKEWRHILGNTDSNIARNEAPDSIRAKYGENKQRNACHGSDSEESARREIQFFFKEAEFNLLTNDIETTRFLGQYIYPTLTKGLEELVKESPKDPILFLGNYLMEHST